jgi:HPt (histidine-containing phosphotransfer) domain-containing protein
MTANVFDEDRQDCLNAGMNDFVAKPVNPKILYSTLAKWLSITQSRGNAMLENGGAVEISDWQQHLLEIPGLDVERGLKNVGGKMAVYLKVLRLLIEHHQKDSQLLEEALASNDLIEMKRLAHTLKGTIGNLGGTKVEKLAEAVHFVIKHEAAQTDITKPCNILITELSALIDAVQNVLAEAERAT